METFAAERGMLVAGAYAENESGASLDRPELFRLLSDSRSEDKERNKVVAGLLAKGVSWSRVQKTTRCGRATVAKVATRAAR